MNAHSLSRDPQSLLLLVAVFVVVEGFVMASVSLPHFLLLYLLILVGQGLDNIVLLVQKSSVVFRNLIVQEDALWILDVHILQELHALAVDPSHCFGIWNNYFFLEQRNHRIFR